MSYEWAENLCAICYALSAKGYDLLTLTLQTLQETVRATSKAHSAQRIAPSPYPIYRLRPTDPPIRRSLPMRLACGQAAMEMVFILPILLTLIGGGMFIVYACWQGIHVQQAANLAARIQGQERLGGGKSLGEIDRQNGVSSFDAADTSQWNKAFAPPSQNEPPARSVYGKYYHLAKNLISSGFQGDHVYISPPLIGQNVDKVRVIHTLHLPKIPFFKWPAGQEQITMEAVAYGGEDTNMYGLPRWGESDQSNGQPEWKNMVRDSKNNPEP